MPKFPASAAFRPAIICCMAIIKSWDHSLLSSNGLYERLTSPALAPGSLAPLAGELVPQEPPVHFCTAKGPPRDEGPSRRNPNFFQTLQRVKILQ